LCVGIEGPVARMDNSRASGNQTVVASGHLFYLTHGNLGSFQTGQKGESRQQYKNALNYPPALRRLPLDFLCGSSLWQSPAHLITKASLHQSPAGRSLVPDRRLGRVVPSSRFGFFWALAPSHLVV
jgi:hypothetical protein